MGEGHGASTRAKGRVVEAEESQTESKDGHMGCRDHAALGDDSSRVHSDWRAGWAGEQTAAGKTASESEWEKTRDHRPSSEELGMLLGHC